MNQYTREIHAQDGVVHLRLKGRYPNEHLRQEQNVFTALIDACEQNHCQKAVIDARDLEVDFNTLEYFRAGVDASELHRYGLRLALVAREEMISSFFDDVIHNRGVAVRVFTDLESASTWVRKNG